jgi:hypothetical protein
LSERVAHKPHFKIARDLATGKPLLRNTIVINIHTEFGHDGILLDARIFDAFVFLEFGESRPPLNATITPLLLENLSLPIKPDHLWGKPVSSTPFPDTKSFTLISLDVSRNTQLSTDVESS